MRITRYYCPAAHETFSLLPDCLASRFPGDLDALERVVAHVDAARSIEAAANVLRPDIVLPSAVRWVRRRLTLVRARLLTVVTLLPDLFGGHSQLVALRAALDKRRTVAELRRETEQAADERSRVQAENAAKQEASCEREAAARHWCDPPRSRTLAAGEHRARRP